MQGERERERLDEKRRKVAEMQRQAETSEVREATSAGGPRLNSHFNYLQNQLESNGTRREAMHKSMIRTRSSELNK
jgi:hypothetical protein